MASSSKMHTVIDKIFEPDEGEQLPEIDTEADYKDEEARYPHEKSAVWYLVTRRMPMESQNSKIHGTIVRNAKSLFVSFVSRSITLEVYIYLDFFLF